MPKVREIHRASLWTKCNGERVLCDRNCSMCNRKKRGNADDGAKAKIADQKD